MAVQTPHANPWFRSEAAPLSCMGSVPQLALTYIQLFRHVTEDEWP